MKVINKKIVITILVILEICNIYLMYKSYNNKNLLEDKIEEPKKEKLAIKVDNGNGEYVYSTDLPGKGYTLNKDLTECIDIEGNKVSNPKITSDGESVTITSKYTNYCTLYYIKNLGIKIKEKKPNGLGVEKIRGGMYRFQGQQTDGIDNYICFGTNDKDTCVKDKDHYMYRIIGIEESGRVKVIKKEALDGKIAWADNFNDDIEFPDSNIYKTINGNGFLLNESFISNGWEDRIANNTWMYGDMMGGTYYGGLQQGEEIYKIETGQKITRYQYKNYLSDGSITATRTDAFWNKKKDFKIGLMYVHDYYLATDDKAICFKDGNMVEECKNSWINLYLNDVDNNQEYLMTRYGYYEHYFTYSVGSNGEGGMTTVTLKFSIRPVFYIDVTETLKDGEGTINNPFIIK